MPATRRVAVAASGGRDSTALLHCTLRQAQPLGVEVVALHVHHGLMPQADAWQVQVRAQARRWGAGFAVQRLAGTPGPGESVEAWARAGRYRALAEMAHGQGCGLVLLAHHRRDQAETWLLQALRGAGPRGLAAMPERAQRPGLTWARPWLDQPREAVEAYVRRHRLQTVEDSSNADPRFARSRLRLQVWPALAAAFPAVESALAAAAVQAQQAAMLAREVAALDLPALLQAGALQHGAWAALPPARRRNALQAWLGPQAPQGLPGSLLDRLCSELPAARTARWPAPGGELRLYRGLLRLHPASLQGPAQGAGHRADVPAAGVDCSRPGTVSVPGWAGGLKVSPAASGGVEPALLQGLLARPREGGERFQIAASGQPRSLKKQYQTCAVPAWQREGPLLYTPDGTLLFVPGLGLDARHQAPAGSPQLVLQWLPATDG